MKNKAALWSFLAVGVTLVASLAVQGAESKPKTGKKGKKAAARAEAQSQVQPKTILVKATASVTRTGRRSDALEIAAEVNRLLGSERASTAQPTARTNDETFLRRVTLDLIGELPTPEEVTAFVLDTDPHKRAHVVERLLENEQYGQNWGRYWRDVILYRRTEDRALLASAALESYLVDQFNQNVGWDQVAKSFITATGDVRENGATALIFGQQGETAETTAEVARIFLGIQIQCANCHNHPTDRWKREQFHELAAFFPRLEIRRSAKGPGRSFEVAGVDRPRPNGPPNQRRAESEHRMPDLNDAAAEGTVMTPKFFVTGRTLPLGTPDAERRETLANWIVGENDPWFPKAYVNRVWGELVGEGFYEPMDDMGPDRQCSAPETMDFLASEFRRSGFDGKWLMQVITATDLYQQESRSRRNAEEPAFAANCSQRMRADQLFNSLTIALGIDLESRESRRELGAGGQQKGRRYGGGGARALLNQAFGYDPSEQRDEITGSIPQALLMMNSPLINGAINARRPGSPLGQLLANDYSDEEIVAELYLRCLAREPNETETRTCLEHVAEVGNRAEAFEDVLWALINSTEFMHRK